MSQIDDWCDGWNEGRQVGIRDCVLAVEAIDDGGDADCRYILASTAATLRALLEDE